MAIEVTLWSLLAGASGVAIKSGWDSYVGWRDKLRFEKWKSHVSKLEDQLSKFYWPLYIRLLRDDNIWTKVFFDLRPSHKSIKPKWVTDLSSDKRDGLRLQIEKEILIPNHIEAVKIITAGMHFCDPDTKLRDMLLRYIRHVDVYSSLRAASINDIEPIDVQEEYPNDFSEVFSVYLKKHQAEYDLLILQRPLGVDLGRSKNSAKDRLSYLANYIQTKLTLIRSASRGG